MTPAATPPSRRRLSAACRRRLLTIYDRYHCHEHVQRDPLTCVYRYHRLLDREVVGLISAALAYGNVTAILRSLDTLLGRMGDRPTDYLLSSTPRTIRRDFAGFRYRVTSDADLIGLLLGVRKVLAEHGSLEAAASHELAGASDPPPHWPVALVAMSRLVDRIVAGADQPLRHLLPHPSRGSACKRLNLYFRWMVRRDAVDPGGWRAIEPADLVVPLDTHLHRVAVSLGLTRRKQANLATAIEVTAALRQVDPLDPLRFDFALTRPGILRLQEPPTGAGIDKTSDEMRPRVVEGLEAFGKVRK